MVSDVLLTPATYSVLQAVPVNWWPIAEVEKGIADATGRCMADVRGRLSQLRRLGLVESRRVQTIKPQIEVRRIVSE